MNTTLLKNATRNELIEELKSRTSITSIQINKNEGAEITTAHCKMAIGGKTNIFVIDENEVIDEKCCEEEKGYVDITNIIKDLFY